MSNIKVNLDEMKAELQRRQQERLAPDRERAIEALSNVIDSTLTLDKVYAFLQLLADKPFVRDSLSSIQLGEIMQTPIVQKAKANRPTRKKTSETETAMTLIAEHMQAQKELVSKAEVLQALAGSGMGEKTFATAWKALRANLTSVGEGPQKRYRWSGKAA
jgi:hypothetical protein